MGLAAVRDIRPQLRLETRDEVGAFEQDLLAEFVLARASAGITDTTISADVAQAVRFARTHGMRIAPQGTGHGAGPLEPLQGTMLLRTSRMRSVRIDPVSRTAQQVLLERADLVGGLQPQMRPDVAHRGEPHPSPPLQLSGKTPLIAEGISRIMKNHHE